MILAIETSCDEVSASLVDKNFRVWKNIIYSSSAKANETGGVVPEIAAREAAKMMTEVLQKVTENINWNTIDSIAVTTGPGLVGSLLTGIEAAKTLAMIYNKPLIPVFHIFGHICANLLEKDEQTRKNLFPCLVLTVSGGHNDIYIWKNELEYTKIGTTLDDAAGECFDKCARMLNLGYPGGPLLSLCAENGIEKNAKIYNFPRPLHNAKGDNIYNFSFSGLKTSLLYKIKDLGGIENCSSQIIADLALGIETAICDSLLQKLFLAQKKYVCRSIALTGGVSANKPLRKKFCEQAQQQNITASLPKEIIFCTDNAAMIGAAAQLIWKNKSDTETFDFRTVGIQRKL